MAAIAARPLLLLTLIAAAAIFASSITVEAKEDYRMGWISAVRPTRHVAVHKLRHVEEGQHTLLEMRCLLLQLLARGPGQPLLEGCSAITRCRQG
ncbi:hypothetical protein QJS10_CPB14g01072 [Acorus calamus]|uniref:Uncharacterized protein n=1 Tax=Acorus calamus TaxID=4465 RepID=A0AAV9DB16_ACOCL|nr:hypothetical protein QJS10_CPB14g01072 [Acorus calamus]